jgi:hypothetical protein
MITQILSFGNSIIDKIFPDKNVSIEAKIKLMELEKSGELNELNSRFKAIIAEAQSQDKYVSRARPTFLYIMYFLILTCIPSGILFAFKPESMTLVLEGIGTYLNSIPAGLYAMFGIGYTGYAVSRSYDKAQFLK